MRTSTEFIAVYFYAGTICANTSETVFNSLEEVTLADWPNRAYAYKLYQQDIVTDTGTGKVYRCDRTEVDGKLYYHPDSKVETLEQVRNNPNATEILIRNMECNGWDSIVWTRYGNWPQPFDKETMCIG